MAREIDMYILNPFFIYICWNIIVIFLYALNLSSLYTVDILFLIIYLFPVMFFALLNINKIKKISKKRIYEIENDKTISDNFFYIMWILFVIGLIASVYQIVMFGTPLELENKVNRPIGDHYVQYLVNLLPMVSMMAYTAIRFNFGRKISNITILILSLALLAIWLNRGAYTPFIVTIFFIEYIKSAFNNNIRKYFFSIFIAGSIFVFIFGYVGNLRTEYVMNNIYHCTVNQWYGMPDYIPTGLAQLYIYLTSPLENARHMFFEQVPWEYHYGVEMLYPYVAVFNKNIFDAHTNFYPYLDYTLPVGLNVSTYFQSALLDFGLIGPYIYMIYITLYFRISYKFCHANVYGLLGNISLIHMSLWMVFVNAFAIGPTLITTLMFIVLSWIREKYHKRNSVDVGG